MLTVIVFAVQLMATTRSHGIVCKAMVRNAVFQPCRVIYLPISVGSSPNCITGVMNWCHGTYQLQPNGSITMVPFGDGYQQVQDPCAAISNFIENYNDTELYVQWNIYQDPTLGYMLQLYQFDGSPLPPMAQLSTSPNMLPTQPLRNVSASSSKSQKRDLEALVRRASGSRRRWGGVGGAGGVVGVLVAVTGLGVAALLL